MKKINRYCLIISALLFINLSAVIFFKHWLSDFDPQKYRFKDMLVTQLAKLTDIFYQPWFLPSTSIPEYRLLVDPQDLTGLYQSLPNPSTQAVLSNSPKISGQLFFQDQTYAVDLKIHGDLRNHWGMTKKSWAIKLADNQSIDGINEFKFILPADRSLLLESFALHLAEKFDLITPRHWFANLYINNQLQGIYYVREDYSDSMLKANQLPDGDIFTEIDDPNNRTSTGVPFPGSVELWMDVKHWKKAHNGFRQNPDDFSRLEQLIALLNQADDDQFKNHIGELVDLDYFFRWQAHAMLLGSFHQDFQHNQVLYLNPATNKFEIIPKEFVVNAEVDLSKPHNSLADRILSIPEFRDQRDQVLFNYLTTENLNSDLDFFNQLFNTYKPFFYRDHKKWLSNWGFNQTTMRQQSQYQLRFETLRDLLSHTTKLVFLGHLYPQFGCLSDIISQLQSHHPDQIIFGGDFIPTEHSLKSIDQLWQKFNKAINKLNTTYQLIPGNHDYYFYSYASPLPQHQVINNNLLIYLDTNSANYPQPFSLPKTTIDYIKNLLSNRQETVFIFLHHPIWLSQKTAGANAFYYAQNWSSLEQILLDYSQPVYLVAGDSSDFIHSTNQNINYYVSGLDKYNAQKASGFLIINIDQLAVDIQTHPLTYSSSCRLKLMVNDLIDELIIK